MSYLEHHKIISNASYFVGLQNLPPEVREGLLKKMAEEQQRIAEQTVTLPDRLQVIINTVFITREQTSTNR